MKCARIATESIDPTKQNLNHCVQQHPAQIHSKGSTMTGKSKEEVAFDILAKLKGVGVWGENNREQILDLYAECLEATSGQRKSNIMR